MALGKVRLSDLAETAGVSTATVSRVLNGKPGVSAQTRQSVQSAMSELGYLPERGKSSGTIAIIVPELSNPSFPTFMEALDAILHAADYPKIVCPAWTAGTSETDYLEMLEGMEIAGIISVSGTPADSQGSDEPYRRLIDLGVPVVFINGYSPDLPAAFFSCSDAAAVAASEAHLKSLGHTRIGLALGSSRYLPSQRKHEAFKQLGYSEDSVAHTVYSAEGGQLAAARLLASGHTAIICGSDLMALGVIREARSQGLRVPEDLSVVGYDDSPLMAFTEPALTTIRQPVRPICKAAVTTLLNAFDGTPMDHTEMLFHPDLVIRQTTGPLK